MHILIVTVLCAVVFGDLSSDNKRLKRTNSALLQALKQMTQSETAKEEAVGDLVGGSIVNYQFCGGDGIDPILSESECAKRDDCDWIHADDKRFIDALYACVRLNKVCNDHPDARKAGQTCDTRWDHLTYWDARWEYCKNDKGTGSWGGCQYGYYDAGWNNECAGKYAAGLTKHKAYCN